MISQRHSSAPSDAGPRRFYRTVVVSCLLACVSACSSTGHQDLDDYVRSVKARPGGRVEPVPEIKSYPSYAYSVGNHRSPFVPDTAEQLAGGSSGPQPVVRNREALENFPLDALKLVGHVEKNGENWAVVTAPDGLVYRVQKGNYMGQNQGKIHTISDDRIQLTELVPGPNGGWIEREASLALSE